MDLELANQTAVVIGAAKGIGRAIAAGFVAEGAAVAMLDLDGDVHDAARQIAGGRPAEPSSFQVDATDLHAMRATAEEVLSRHETVHHVVYAAGAGSGKYGFPFWNLEPSDWQRVWHVNLMGAVHAAHVFCPVLTAQRAGTLLFLSSIAGQIGSQTDPPYSAAKAALINFAQCAAKDLAPYDVRVNTICPGMVQTAVNRSVWEAWCRQHPEDQRQPYEAWAGEKVQRVAPLGRWQTVDDVAALALFLASPRAGNITGQTMNVDGGQVMHW